MNRVSLSAIACLMFSGVTFAQRERPLEITKQIPVANLTLHTLLTPVKCDPDENIYLQLPDSKNLLGGPVIRISPDGRKVVRYQLTLVPRFDGASVVDFAPSTRNDLYVIARQTDGKQYLVHFDSDGKYDWHRSLRESLEGEEWEAKQIGVFGTGDLVIAGSRTKESKTGVWSAAVVGLFDSAGQLLREIPLADDTKLKAAPKTMGANSAATAAREERNNALSFTTIEAADDGNLYLTRVAGAGPVYVLAPDGRVLHTLRLSPPKGDSLSAVKLGKGRVVAEFTERSKNSSAISRVLLQVLDATTGEKYAEYYHSSARIGSALACYEPDDFSFLAVDSSNGAVVLVHAHPQ